MVYSTHAPAFLNVGRLEELAFVRSRSGAPASVVHQPGPFPAASDFRTLSEFDAERSELFLARAVLLVEGVTEKLDVPVASFRALGHDADREAISIVECGGKAQHALLRPDLPGRAASRAWSSTTGTLAPGPQADRWASASIERDRSARWPVRGPDGRARARLRVGRRASRQAAQAGARLAAVHGGGGARPREPLARVGECSAPSRSPAD